MKKIISLSLLILISLKVVSQNIEKPQIASIEHTSWKGVVKKFNFEDGKLKTITSSSSRTLYYNYNNKGQLTSRYYLSNNDNKKKVSYNLEYDDQGLLIKYTLVQGDTINYETNFTHDYTDNQNFRVTSTGRPSYSKSKHINLVTYEMKNNQLSLFKELRIGKFKSKTVDDYKLENGNLTIHHYNKKSSKEFSKVKYTFDDKPGLHKLFSETMYDDKYFINTILFNPVLNFTNGLFVVSNNNIISSQILDKGKKVGVTEYDYVIDYDPNGYPKKITKSNEYRNKPEVYIITYK